MNKDRYKKIIIGCICVVLATIVFWIFDEREDVVEKETTTKPTTTETTTLIENATKISPTPNVKYFVPASAKTDKSYFDDVIFVGDSITQKLNIYNMSTQALGNAEFLCAISLSPYNSLWSLNRNGNVHPTYNGQKMRVPDAIKASGRTKVYIMLGMNDIEGYGVDRTIGYLKELLTEITETNPNVQLYMQSLTPVCAGKNISNDAVVEYNQKLSELCKQQKWYYVDVAAVFRDETGALITEYCSDPDGMGLHFTNAGCQVWADYLHTHTAN